MRLLWFNLATDAADPILGFTSQWIRAVAERVEYVRVITMRAGRLELPQNVQCLSVGKELGRSRPSRVLLFYRYLFRVLRDEPIDACFSHMMPLFSVLAAPVLRRTRIPLATWYAHPSVTLQLKLAHYFSDAMVTSLPSAYPYRRDKLHVIGQGIDTERFAPNATRPEEPPMILCAGRLSPVKDHPTLLRAAVLLRALHDERFRIVILGGPATPADVGYRASLDALVRELSLGGIVRFEDAVAPARLAEWYRRCAVHVNLTPTGFGDKVALESLACARPTVVANDGFRDTLGTYAGELVFRHRDPEDLARRLAHVLSLSEEGRRRMGLDLRQRIELLHGLPGLATRLLSLLESLTSTAFEPVRPPR